MKKVLSSDFVHLDMPANGDAQARRFYGDLLGFAERPGLPNPASRRGVWFECGRVQLHLGAVADWPAKPTKSALPTLPVEDLQRVMHELIAGGFAAKMDLRSPPRTPRAVAVDPFGNLIALREQHSRRHR